MKKAEIKVGGKYLAKVNNKLTTVRVDEIEKVYVKSYVVGGRRDKEVTIYAVTNLTTGRKTTFRSAAKFRSEVK